MYTRTSNTFSEAIEASLDRAEELGCRGKELVDSCVSLHTYVHELSREGG